MIHNVIILGSGPAGLTAGIYTARATLAPLIIDGRLPGGQLMTTTDVENWPGNISIKGPDLMMNMREHATHYGATFLSELITKVDFSTSPYKLFTETGDVLETKSVIITTGSAHRKLNVSGEAEYWGKGVTTCATCDGPFYKDREVVIAGGGNTAVTEASFLSRFASKITIVQNLAQLSANDPLKFKVLEDPKVKILYSSKIIEVNGDGNHLGSITVEHQETKQKTTIPCAGLFIAIGFKPNTDLFINQLDIDSYGYLKLNGATKTSKEGIFAAGDVCDYRYMQAITSAGFGCMAALDAEQYLRSKEAQKS